MKMKGMNMSKEEYKLIKSIENKQAIEHQLEQLSQLVDKLEKHLKERGII
jgi:hypothetical protein